MIKYLVMSTDMMSKNDKTIHQISADDLIKLYGVDRRECIISRSENDFRGYSKEYLDSLVLLRPRYDGNYRKIEILKENK